MSKIHRKSEGECSTPALRESLVVIRFDYQFRGSGKGVKLDEGFFGDLAHNPERS